MLRQTLLAISVVSLVGFIRAEYNVGAGIADVTGPIAGITLMGYGSLEQQGSGVHLRQWARAFIVERDESPVVFVNVDCGMMADGVRIKAVETLSHKYKGLYHMDNVIISGTHTHSGVGGYLMHSLFDLPSFGFSQQTFDALVSGIVKSVDMAHRRLQKGNVYLKMGRVDGANINRSPTSYQANPEEERQRYSDNVDKTLTQLQLISVHGEPIGAINWFAVHATSMNNTNTLVSSDNVGYASILFEKMMNDDKLLGKGPFVAAFASSNLGDVSPNVRGPLCHPSGDSCSDDSSCSSVYDSCFALGPGEDMFESTRLIGETIFDVAWELWNEKKPKEILSGPTRGLHQYVHMPSAKVQITDKNTNDTVEVSGCKPAMGYSFAAGTIDGPFATNVVQQGTTSPIALVNAIRNTFLAKPTQADHECHAPKPILIFTGGMSFPFDWQPHTVSTQLAQIGNVWIACVPGEFTTMSGRRMRRAIQEIAGDDAVVIIAGLCNTYSDYITTFEEYQNKILERGPEPPGLRESKLTLIPPVILDWAGYHRKFGDVVEQPNRTAAPGDVVTVTFISGHPRNGLKLDDTYCTVEMETEPGIWKVVHTDADWETRFHWKRSWSVLGTSTAKVEFFVPEEAEIGTYRIRHFGHYKELGGDIWPFEGTSRKFQILMSSNGYCNNLPWWR